MDNKVLIQHFEKVPAFVTVARVGSIRKASDILAVSQPALSQTLKRLEDVLGVQLFSRSRLGIKLTPQGEIFLESAQKILENIDLLESRIRKKEQDEIKRLRIGTHEALAIHIWPHLIETYMAKNKNHLLSITSNRIGQLTKQVQNREIDLTLTVTPNQLSGVRCVKIYSDNFAFYASPKLKGLTKKNINLRELSVHPILTDNQAHLAQDRPVLREMSGLGLYSSSYFQLNSFEASIQLADKGLGIAFLPVRIAESLKTRFKINKLTIKDIPSGHFKHHLCVSYLENNLLAENMCLFIKQQLKK